MTPTRRSFITATAALFCAPAIVRASSLMPVRGPKLVSVDPRKLLAPISEDLIGVDGRVVIDLRHRYDLTMSIPWSRMWGEPPRTIRRPTGPLERLR